MLKKTVVVVAVVGVLVVPNLTDSESSPTPVGPVFADPMMSGSAAFVWATAYENPPVALDTPAAGAEGGEFASTTYPVTRLFPRGTRTLNPTAGGKGEGLGQR